MNALSAVLLFLLSHSLPIAIEACQFSIVVVDDHIDNPTSWSIAHEDSQLVQTTGSGEFSFNVSTSYVLSVYNYWHGGSVSLLINNTLLGVINDSHTDYSSLVFEDIDCETTELTLLSSTVNECNVTFTFTPDEFPNENSWSIYETSIPSDIFIGVEDEGYDLSFTNAQSYSVDGLYTDRSYTLYFHDDFNDGICCTYGSGSIEFSINEVRVLYLTTQFDATALLHFTCAYNSTHFGNLILTDSASTSSISILLLLGCTFLSIMF